MMLVEAPILRAKRVMMEPDTKTKEKELKRLKDIECSTRPRELFCRKKNSHILKLYPILGMPRYSILSYNAGRCTKTFVFHLLASVTRRFMRMAAA